MRRTLVLLAVTALLGGAGCTRADPKARRALDDASAATRRAGSAKAAVTISGAATRASAKGEGLVDIAHDTSTFTFGARPALAIELRAVAGTTFALLSGQLAPQGQGDRWITGSSAVGEPQFSVLLPPSGVPAVLKLMTSRKLVPRFDADTKVQDMPTKVVRTPVDPVDVVPAFSEVARKRGSKIADQMHDRMEATFRVWIDGTHLVRMFQLTVPKPRKPIKGFTYRPFTLTVELSDFGVAVAVEAPPAEQVVTPRPAPSPTPS